MGSIRANLVIVGSSRECAKGGVRCNPGDPPERGGKRGLQGGQAHVKNLIKTPSFSPEVRSEGEGTWSR